MKIQNGLLGFASVIFLVLFPATAPAAIISINTYVTGEDPGVTSPVATINLTQDGGDVDFLLTNSVSNLGAAANSDTFISDVGFTFSQSSTLTAGSFINFGGTQTPTIVASDFSIDPNGNFQGGYNFFLELEFPTSNAGGGINRFKNGETASWTITNASVSDFLSPLVSGTGSDAIAAVHIQSLASGQSTTFASAAIPEPSSLLPLAVIGAVGVTRRRWHRPRVS